MLVPHVPWKGIFGTVWKHWRVPCVRETVPLAFEGRDWCSAKAPRMHSTAPTVMIPSQGSIIPRLGIPCSSDVVFLCLLPTGVTTDPVVFACCQEPYTPVTYGTKSQLQRACGKQLHAGEARPLQPKLINYTN